MNKGKQTQEVKHTESVILSEKERQLVANAVYFDIAHSVDLIERMDGKMHESAKRFLTRKVEDLKALHKKIVSNE